MVARITSGKSMRGVINYNENKVKAGQAICIHAAGFVTAPEILTFHQKLERFEKLNSKNPKAKINVIHISLNFDPADELDKNKLTKIAKAYMSQLGFARQPYLVYQHFDAAHPHIHIVSSLVAKDGKRIDIHNIGRNESELARKAIELDFGLLKAEERKPAKELFMKPIPQHIAQYGRSETKRSISNIVTFVVRSYKYTSLPELNAVLNQYNIIADSGKEDTMMNKKKGLVYSILDGKGNKIGVPIKASSIYGKPTISNLEKQFKLNEALRSPHKERIKNALDQFFTIEKVPSLANFQEWLSRRNVDVVLRQNHEGRIYGLTFIDNQNKVVFNGSDLGKQYSAKAIMERLIDVPKSGSIKIGTSKERPLVGGIDVPAKSVSGADLPKPIKDLISAEQNLQGVDPALMRRRRKRKGRSL